jgi:hypothetical protein
LGRSGINAGHSFALIIMETDRKSRKTYNSMTPEEQKNIVGEVAKKVVRRADWED